MREPTRLEDMHVLLPPSPPSSIQYLTAPPPPQNPKKQNIYDPLLLLYKFACNDRVGGLGENERALCLGAGSPLDDEPRLLMVQQTKSLCTRLIFGNAAEKIRIVCMRVAEYVSC